MAKLTGSAIAEARERGDIIIDPFDPKSLGPNSYDLRLGDTLRMYSGQDELDPRRDNATVVHTIPPEGRTLIPGCVYLAHTIEVAGTRDLYVPCVEGRSSCARLGLFVHVTAGFGDVGFVGQWTLELVATEPVRVYPGMRICQIYFDTLEGAIDRRYEGKYQGAVGPEASRFWRDWQ